MQELRLPIDLETLGVLCRRYDVAELAVFGSGVRGEDTDDSDVDFLVEFKPGARIGLFRFESFTEELEAMMGRKVDLVTKRGLKPWVRPNVLREARTVYAE